MGSRPNHPAIEAPFITEEARRLLTFVFLGVFPVLVTVSALWIAHLHDVMSIDFHNELYPEARDVLHGRDPYPPPDADLSSGARSIWPVAAVLAVTPLALLPAGAADWAMAIVELACLGGALLLAGVRDWRVYGAALLWPSVINATQAGNATLPLAVLCAVAWRYRSALLAPGIAIGVGISIKFFVWPLVLWLACIRRYAAAVLAAAVGTASLLLILPFDSIRNYGGLLQNLSRTFDDDSYTLYGLLVELGAPSPIARAAWLTVGLAVLVTAWWRRSFALFVGAALLLSPIVWLHFFALMLVPLAVIRPIFSWVWLIPLSLWFVPGTANGRPWQNALALCTFATLLVVCARGENQGAREGATALDTVDGAAGAAP